MKITIPISDYVASFVRTAASYAVSFLLSLKIAGPVLTYVGVTSATARERIYGLLVFVLGSVYYLIVRALERKWPVLGLFLGIPAKPSYIDATGAHAAGTVPVVTSLPAAAPTTVINVHTAAPATSTAAGIATTIPAPTSNATASTSVEIPALVEPATYTPAQSDASSTAAATS